MGPIRTCVVCRRRGEAATFIRISRNDQRGWYRGAGEGRGLHVCATGDCASNVQRTHLARSLRVSVSAQDEEIVRQLLVR